jgi:hypothetical protein
VSQKDLATQLEKMNILYQIGVSINRTSLKRAI